MYDRQIAQFLDVNPIQYSREHGCHRIRDGWRQYLAPSIRQGFAQIKQSTTFVWAFVKYRKKNRTTTRGRWRALAARGNPPLLTNGDSPTWIEWHQGIQYKRSQNADHFPTETAEVQYVLSRLSGNAYKKVQANHGR